MGSKSFSFDEYDNSGVPKEPFPLRMSKNQFDNLGDEFKRFSNLPLRPSREEVEDLFQNRFDEELEIELVLTRLQYEMLIAFIREGNYYLTSFGKVDNADGVLAFSYGVAQDVNNAIAKEILKICDRANELSIPILAQGEIYNELKSHGVELKEQYRIAIPPGEKYIDSLGVRDEFIKRIKKERGHVPQKVFLACQAWHAVRCKRICEEAGLEVVGGLFVDKFSPNDSQSWVRYPFNWLVKESWKWAEETGLLQEKIRKIVEQSGPPKLSIHLSLLWSRGYALSSGVLEKAWNEPDILNDAIRNLSPGMVPEMHAIGSPSGLVGLPFSVRKSKQKNIQEICLNKEITVSHPDKSYPGYLESVEEAIDKAREGKPRSFPPVPTTKYEFNPVTSEYRPVEFQGITIISPPYEDFHSLSSETIETYERLTDAQEYLFQRFRAEGIVRADCGIPMIAIVPSGTLHITLADMLYAEKYTKFMRGLPAEEEFLTKVKEFLPKATQQIKGQFLRFRIPGVMIMTDAIGARILPNEKTDYENLCKFREVLYDNPDLQNLGLAKSGSYFGHVTLGYLPDRLDEEKLAKTVKVVQDLNKDYFDVSCSLKIEVEYADVRYFPNMESYNPLLFRASFA